MFHRADIIHSHPEIQSGAIVFVGTRVPVQNLLDYLSAGETLAAFLEDFPSVSEEQARGALALAGQALSTSASPS